MTRETLAVLVLVWLIGALVGWFVGWAARGEQNRAWHGTLKRQLAETRAQLDAALAESDTTYTRAEDYPASPPAVVNIHLTTPLQWAGQPSLGANPSRTLTAVPVLPGEGAES